MLQYKVNSLQAMLGKGVLVLYFKRLCKEMLSHVDIQTFEE
jgi:hypothetical protein